MARALDWRFEVHHPGGVLGDEISRLLRPLRDEGPSSAIYRVHISEEGRASELMLDGVVVGTSLEPRAIVNLLVWSINQELVTRSARHVLIHAGAVASKGSAVVLLGASGAGKSTLTTGLALAGYSYLTDEAVALSLEDGLIDRFPRCATLKRGSWSLFPELDPPAPVDTPSVGRDQFHVDLSLHGSGAGQHRPHPALVLRLHRETGAALEARPLSDGQALLAVLDHVMNGRRMTSSSLDMLHDTVRKADAYDVTYDSLEQAVGWVSSALAEASATP